MHLLMCILLMKSTIHFKVGYECVFYLVVELERTSGQVILNNYYSQKMLLIAKYITFFKQLVITIHIVINLIYICDF
jgi:hypothetical protein